MSEDMWSCIYALIFHQSTLNRIKSLHELGTPALDNIYYVCPNGRKGIAYMAIISHAN